MGEMISKSVRFVIGVAAVTLLLGLGAPVAASEDQSEAPKVGERYQEAIDTAWAKAGAGDDPSMTCARVKGTVVGTGDSDAFRALFACNVEIPVRYFDTCLDRVATGEKSCQDLMREVLTKLSAMTMSADLVVEMAENLERGADSQTAIADALGAAAAGTMTDDGLKDPKRLVKDRIADRTNELCPDFASAILN